MSEPLGQSHLPASIIPAWNARSLAENSATMAELGAKLEAEKVAKSAKGLLTRLAESIRGFEATLDPDVEVGISLASFGQSIQIRVKAIAYIDPNLIVIEGFSGASEPVRLVQHMSQLNFLLMKLPRLAPDTPRQPIGFRIDG
jgi:Family of unknown function (DUF6173)